MKKTEDIREILKEMETVAAEIKLMRKADKLHNLFIYGYKAIIRKEDQ